MGSRLAVGYLLINVHTKMFESTLQAMKQHPSLNNSCVAAKVNSLVMAFVASVACVQPRRAIDKARGRHGHPYRRHAHACRLAQPGCLDVLPEYCSIAIQPYMSLNSRPCNSKCATNVGRWDIAP